MPPRNLSAKKKAAMAAATTALLLAAIELAGRAAYFQGASGRWSSIAYYIREIQDSRARREARRFAKRMQKREGGAKPPASGAPAPQGGAKDANPAEPTLARADEFDPRYYTLTEPQVRARYEEIFAKFAEFCQARGIALVVVHAPDPYTDASTRDFFAGVCARRSVPFVDLMDEFAKLPAAATHWLPMDPHLNPYGCKMLAEAVAERLKPLLDHRAPPAPPGRPPALFGDNTPAKTRVTDDPGKPPYRVTINAQGLRAAREHSLKPDPKLARVLCVGDSFTFGIFVSDPQTYPSQLQAALPAIEAINGGVPGYTICDELAYLQNRGAWLSPDIVVLQVLNNDLYGLQPVWQEKMCRYHRVPNEPRGEYCYQK